MKPIPHLVISIVSLSLMPFALVGRTPQDVSIGFSEIELDAIRRTCSEVTPDWWDELSPGARRVLLRADVVLVVIDGKEWTFRVRESLYETQRAEGSSTDVAILTEKLRDDEFRRFVNSERKRSLGGTSWLMDGQAARLLALVDGGDSRAIAMAAKLGALFGHVPGDLRAEAFSLQDHGEALSRLYEISVSQELEVIRAIADGTAPVDSEGSFLRALAWEVVDSERFPAHKAAATWQPVEGEPSLFSTNVAGGLRCYVEVPEDKRAGMIEQPYGSAFLDSIDPTSTTIFCGYEGGSKAFKIDAVSLKGEVETLRGALNDD